jgi:thiopeptide-type bacteriocin biosynthesis protein
MTGKQAQTVDEDPWIQVNCTLYSTAVAGPPFVPWQELSGALQRWRGEERFQQAFFMRKPPGIRLRFSGRNVFERLEPELVSWLEDADQRNLIRSFRFSVYEPEQFRFGGPAGMAIAHDQFDLDSRIALAYESLLPAAQAGLPRDLLSLLAATDLFSRCVDDGAEMWDIWQRLRAAVGGGPTSAVQDVDRERSALSLTPEFVNGLAPEAVHLIEEARGGNERIAARLHAAVVAERLTIGVRSWLTGVCIFHWNRLGLTTEDLEPLTARMLAMFAPFVSGGEG